MGQYRSNHQWTEEELEIVRRDYQGTVASRREIAARLGVTEYGVAGQVGKLGVGKVSDRNRWSQKEVEYLKNHIGTKSIADIAKAMGRSINSVTVKSKKLKLHRRYRDGWYTKRETCEILGVDHKWLQRRIDSGELKASFHHGHKPCQKGAGAWHISEKAVRDYLINHSEELNGRNVDLMAVVHILTGAPHANP